MCVAAWAYSHHYIIILYTCNSRGTRRRYMMHLAVCSYYFFFVPLSTPPLSMRFIFSPTSLTNLIHYYYYYPDTWCIVIGTIGVVYRNRPLRQSPLLGSRGLFSPQSLDDPLSTSIILLANDRKPIAATL